MIMLEDIGYGILSFFLGWIPLLLFLASLVLGVLTLFHVVGIEVFLISLAIFVIAFLAEYLICYYAIEEFYENNKVLKDRWKNRLFNYHMFIFPIWFIMAFVLGFFEQ